MHSGDNENQLNDSTSSLSLSNKNYKEAKRLPSAKTPELIFSEQSAYKTKIDCEAILTDNNNNLSKIARSISTVAIGTTQSLCDSEEEEDVSESSALLGSDSYLKGILIFVLIVC